MNYKKATIASIALTVAFLLPSFTFAFIIQSDNDTDLGGTWTENYYSGISGAINFLYNYRTPGSITNGTPILFDIYNGTATSSYALTFPNGYGGNNVGGQDFSCIAPSGQVGTATSTLFLNNARIHINANNYSTPFYGTILGSSYQGAISFGLGYSSGCDTVISPQMSTTTALSFAFFNSQNATSTLNDLAGRCSQTSNLFSEGLCTAGVYLFIPSQESLNQFINLQGTLQTKFPFSYVSSITTTWSGLVASSTANSPTYAMNYGSLGIGSTTPLGNILPNFDALSASTTKSYFPSGTFDLLKSLAGIAILLTLFADIFFTSRNLIHK